MLIEKLNALVKVVTERNIRNMELMNLEARTLDDSSYTLVDSLAKLVSMLSLIPGSPEFYFACTLIDFFYLVVLSNCKTYLEDNS